MNITDLLLAYVFTAIRCLGFSVAMDVSHAGKCPEEPENCFSECEAPKFAVPVSSLAEQ